MSVPDLPQRIVELLSKPDLTALPENPVGAIWEEFRQGYEGFELVDLPEKVDPDDLTRLLGGGEWAATPGVPGQTAPPGMAPVGVDRTHAGSGCTWTLDPTDPYSQDEGFALLIGNSGNVVVEDNLLERNKMGLAVYSSSDVDIRHNTIRTTRLKNSLRLERVTSSTVAANLLEDNGIPEEFWAPGHRVIGIYLVRSRDIDVYDNTVLRSSSDGISVGGQIDGGGLTTRESDWTGIPFIASSGNRVEDDLHFRIGGALGQAIEDHLAVAEVEGTWEERGWFSCEIEEGVLDDACVAAQAALGVQGIPSHYLLFDPLMADPDPYVLFEACP